MNALRLLPVVLSAVLIAAHYLRAGSLPLACVCLTSPVLLFVRRPWVPRAAQIGLALAAGVWLMTAIEIVGVRMSLGVPWTAAALILGAVVAWTVGAAVLFETKALKNRYKRGTRSL